MEEWNGKEPWSTSNHHSSLRYNVRHSFLSLENHICSHAELSWIFLAIIPVDNNLQTQSWRGITFTEAQTFQSSHIHAVYFTRPLSLQNLHSSLEPLALLPWKSSHPPSSCVPLHLAVQSGECFLAICPLLSIQGLLYSLQTLSHSYSSQHCITKGQHTCLRMAEPSMVESRPRREPNQWTSWVYKGIMGQEHSSLRTVI